MEEAFGVSTRIAGEGIVDFTGTDADTEPTYVGHEPGAVLDERFDLERRLGADALAEVWRATDRQLRRPVVVRILHEELLADPSVIDRFRREALAAASLSHGHVATVFDVEVGEQVAYTVGEYVDGPSLARVLAEGTLDPVAVTAVGYQAASGLAAAHELGIVHRDVRPGNVLIGRDGRVRMVGFGSAVVVDEERPGVLGRTRGAYAAPEQLEGGQATGSSDVYALGLVLWQSMADTSEFERDPVEAERRLVDRVLDVLPPVTPHAADPARLQGWLDLALDRDPVRRPSAADLSEGLRELHASQGEEQLREVVSRIPEAEHGRLPG